jgi:hypothetical protein
VAPGAVTPGTIAAQLDGNGPNYNEHTISAMHPMNRIDRPEKIADTI